MTVTAPLRPWKMSWYMLDDHEPADSPIASVGRNRARKSDGNAVAQAGYRRARDDRADLLEARLPRAHALARERADDVHSAGCAPLPYWRRGDHRERGRGPAHPGMGGA